MGRPSPLLGHRDPLRRVPGPLQVHTPSPRSPRARYLGVKTMLTSALLEEKAEAMAGGGPVGGRASSGRAGTRCPECTDQLRWALPTGKGIHAAEVRSEPGLPSRGGASSLPTAGDTDGIILKVELTPKFPSGPEGTG